MNEATGRVKVIEYLPSSSSNCYGRNGRGRQLKVAEGDRKPFSSFGASIDWTSSRKILLPKHMVKAPLYSKFVIPFDNEEYSADATVTQQHDAMALGYCMTLPWSSLTVVFILGTTTPTNYRKGGGG